MDWDLSSYFKEFDGQDYQAFKRQLFSDLEQSSSVVDELQLLTKENRSDWTCWIKQLEDLVSRFGHLNSYLGCLCAADATHEGYAREQA